jgi:hypothetical protein
MDYRIGMKLPRSYLGTAGNNLVNGLAAQATKKGVPVHLGEMIDLNIKLGGTITSPLIKTDLKEAAGDAAAELKQQATAFVQQKRDSAKQVVTDSFQVVKKQVLDDAKQSLLKSLAGNGDTATKPPALQETKEKATQTVKNTLNGLFGKKKPGK